MDCRYNQKVYDVGVPPNAEISIHSIPTTLYRFVPEDFALDFLAGRLRLSPVSSYRDMTCIYRRDASDGQQARPISPTEAARELFRLNVTHAFGEGNRIVYKNSAMLSLCMSRYPFELLRRRFEAGDCKRRKYACIEITNAKVFLQELDRAVRADAIACGREVLGSMAGEMNYFEGDEFRVGEGGLSQHPAFLKPLVRIKDGTPNVYGDEAEYRAVWDFPGRDDLDFRVVKLSTPGDLRVLPLSELWPDSRLSELAVKIRLCQAADKAGSTQGQTMG